MENNLYSKVFKADKYIDMDSYVAMDKDIAGDDNVIIKTVPHVHYICGTSTMSECDHKGIDSHSSASNRMDYIATYSKINQGSIVSNQWSWTEGLMHWRVT